MKEHENDNQNESKITSCLNDGNKQLLYFLFIFIFIHFTIIIPFKHSSKNYEVEQASISIEKQINLIDKQIFLLEQKRDSIPVETSNKIEEQLYKYQTQKIQYQKDQIELSKQKTTDRSFNLPILNISINESIIRTIYPGFILVGLCLVLFKRKKFIDLYNISRKTKSLDIEFPFWAVPIPIAIYKEKISSWLYKNILGIATHYLLLYTALDFMLFENKAEFNYKNLFEGKGVNFEVLAINLLLILSTLIIYLHAIIFTIKLEWNKK